MDSEHILKVELSGHTAVGSIGCEEKRDIRYNI